MNTFKLYRQYDQVDCGPTGLRNLSDSWWMIAKHHERRNSMGTLRQKRDISRAVMIRS